MLLFKRPIQVNLRNPHNMNNISDDVKNYICLMFDGSSRICVGSSAKPRKCRFCGKIEPDTSFDNDTAHAISESIGNTNFICVDECKACNHLFSNFEQGFYNAHAPILLLSGVFGKNNSKRLHPYKSFSGADCRYLFLEDGRIMIEGNNLGVSFDDISKTHKLLLNPDFKFERFKHIDIYKSLCKYVISMMEFEYLDKFEHTKKWLFDNAPTQFLPKVLTAQHPIFLKQPRLAYFIRRNEDRKNIPYAIGLFRFTYITYLFIIPFANGETQYPDEDWLMNFAKFLDKDIQWYSVELNRFDKISSPFPFDIENIVLGETCFLVDKSQFNFND